MRWYFYESIVPGKKIGMIVVKYRVIPFVVQHLIFGPRESSRGWHIVSGLILTI